MSGDAVQCVWLKRDLRVLDHRPLAEAAQRGPVLAVYIIEPEIMAAADFDAVHWSFIREALEDVAVSLRGLGSGLWVRRGAAVVVLAELREAFAFEAVWAHEETGNALTFARDRAVAVWAREAGVAFHELPQTGVVRGLRDRNGWARQWETRMAEPITPVPRRLRAPRQAAAAVSAQLDLPAAAALGLSAGSGRQADVRGGESEALRTLRSFITTRGKKYHREMSSPVTAYDSCSRLSAHLAWGCISMRTVVQAVREAAGNKLPKIAAQAFLSRCHWHCHFMQKLESEPAIEFHAFNRACDDLRTGDGKDGGAGGNREWLSAWQEGRTGYPFIDACMRSLTARCWINFRMRAMLVSFASYHLWLDWRLFKDWLACQFIDYEPGIHISQVQMQSGLTGINTLRIYNPIKQGQDHDPEGAFIREWVPELRQVETELIHTPWAMPALSQDMAGCRIGKDYPLPLVDHKEAIRHARARFSALRQRDDYWQASRAVMKRHGSRKRSENNTRPKRPVRPKETAQTELDLGFGAG